MKGHSLIVLLQNSSYPLKAGAVSEKRRLGNSSLEEISIRNLGVIENASIEFSKGLTVLTGETGAGKTMVLTALGLVLGSKSDGDLVRTGSERSIVSARFLLSHSLASAISEAGDDVPDDELIITRSVSAEGKSRINIGGALSTASRASELSLDLIEIHGQSNNAKLLKSSVQRDLLDLFVKSSDELVEYQACFDHYKEIDLRISELREQLSKADSEISSLTLFADAFSKVIPKSGELEAIEQEIQKLGSVEELHSTITTALNLVESEDQPVTSTLLNARKLLDQVRDKDSALTPLLDKYSELVLDLGDVVSDLLLYLTRLEADPQRFEYLQERKAAINSLIKKFGQGSDKAGALSELIDRYDNTQQRIADLSGGEKRIAELERERGEVFSKLRGAARKLSEKRSLGAEKLSTLVTGEIRSLSMPNASFICDVKHRDLETYSEYSHSGIDDVTFLFAGHSGAQALPLAKVASGGENSRVMLAIAVVLAESSHIGTYIFDEVDAGVGGAAAVEVGRRLKALAKSAQVIVVTHLAQVAVWADNHLVVQKDQTGSVSASGVTPLSLDDRKVEIARMLSGQSQSLTAQEHASELLELVQKSSRA